MPHVPTPGEAAQMVANAERIDTAVRAAAAWRYVAWLVGMAVATVMYFTSLGVAGEEDMPVVATTVAFVLCVAVLSVTLLPGSRVMSSGLGRRWSVALLSWGLLFGAAMSVGLLLLRGELAFWLPAGVLAALPLALGGRAEARAGARP